MLVNRYEYPSLDLLMWDMHTDVIDGALALKIYETKWRYLNPHEISDEEMALIQTLANEYGDGYFWGRLRKRKIKYVKPLAWPPLSQTIIFKKPP